MGTNMLEYSCKGSSFLFYVVTSGSPFNLINLDNCGLVSKSAMFVSTPDLSCTKLS